MTLESKLDKAIKAVCPIDGISFGVLTDKTTWSIQFKPEATTQQRADAQAVIDAFDLNATDIPDTGSAYDQRQYEEMLERFRSAVDNDNTVEALRLVPQLLLLKRS